MAVDTAGNILIADYGNHRIRKVDAATQYITTVAGNGTAGYSGDGDPATSASLHYPIGVAVDTAANIFIADQDNNRIRKVDAATEYIITMAGNGIAGYSGDGDPATSASLNHPKGVAVDTAGNIFIGDTGNHRIRRVGTTYFKTYQISGVVLYGDAPLPGVVMKGLPEDPTTSSNGYYIGRVPPGWSGTVTPTLAGYNFSPSSETYTSVTSNQATNYTAFPLLIFSTFDNDTVDLPPPTTGAPSHPTSIVQPVTGTINVKSASNGLTTQPVEINDGGNDDYYGSVDYTFSPLSTGILCVEATVSINKLLPTSEYGYFLQTSVGISTAVVTRLSMYPNGSIIAGGTQVGTYQANTPFRVRKLVDMDTETWSVVIDNEMNGFDDDDMFTGLLFSNDPIQNVGALGASLHSYNISGVTSIAYDDIFVGKI